jgi:hypothetical protein
VHGVLPILPLHRKRGRRHWTILFQSTVLRSRNRKIYNRDPYTWLPDDLRSSGNSGDLIRWLITPQRFDGYSYAENNPIRYSDPTGLSHYLVCCDNQACTNFCADDDAPNSNPGGSEGSQKYLVGDPDDSNQSDDSKGNEDDDSDTIKPRSELCKDCDCKDRPDIKALKKLKTKVHLGELGITAAYALLCGIVGAMLCAAGGPVAIGCGVFGAAFCGIVFGELTRVSMEDFFKDIDSIMDQLKCSCAIYCD